MSEEAATREDVGTASAPAPATDAAATPAASQPDPKADAGAAQDTRAEPSTEGKEKEKGAEPPKTPYEAVKARYEEQRAQAEKRAGRVQKPEESPPADKGTKEKEPPKADGGERAELTGKIPKPEWDALPPREKQRITQYRTALKERETRIAQIEPAAQSYDGIVKYCTENKVSPENYRYTLGLVAAINNDPVRAWNSLQPIITYLRKQIGEELPADLAGRVEKGELSEDAARELARTKAEAERSNARLVERNTADVRARAEGERIANAEREHAEITTKLSGWEQQWKSTDADYPKKWPHVWKRMQPELAALIATGKPVTVKTVTEIANRAKEDVEEVLGLSVPARREIRPVNGSGPSNARPVPKTSFDAVKAAYDAGRA